MSRAPSNLETEIKLPLDDLAALKRRLARLGFSIAKRRVFEINILVDTPAGALQRERKLLRLRQAGSLHTLTFKGPPIVSGYKSRVEIESEIADREAVRRIFEHLGYEPVFRYEKYRTEYAKTRQAGSVMLDETPIGDFLELEGTPRWIDRTALALGRSPAGYITASYGTLYLEYCRAKGIKPGNMVFGRRRQP